MIQGFNTRPLYMQVRDFLANRIARDELKVGAALPNEFSLSQQLEVSVGTVRKAIDVLVSERIIVRHQGRGTFVASRLSEEAQNKLDRIRDGDGSFITWRLFDHEIDIGPANDLERIRLKLGEDGALVARVSRSRAVGGRLAMLEKTSLPANRFPIVGARAAVETTIVNLAYAHGIMLGECEEGIETLAADARTAALFGVEIGTPLLQLDRIVFDMDGFPVEWRISICHLDGLKYVSHTR